MAALFLLAMALILWQATRTHPLVLPDYATVVKPGEQVFPIAVPNWQAPEIPAEPRARFDFLTEHSVRWPGEAPAAACDLFVRMSLQHWARLSLTPARLQALAADGGAGTTAAPASFYWTGQDFLDDDDGDGDRLDAGELHAAGPGAAAEAFCQP